MNGVRDHARRGRERFAIGVICAAISGLIALPISLKRRGPVAGALHCATARRLQQLHHVGRGGTEATPDELQPAF